MRRCIAFNLTSNGLFGLIPSEMTLLSETLSSLDLSDSDVDISYEELYWLAELTNLRKLDVRCIPVVSGHDSPFSAISQDTP
jgi:hypothetical protein